MTYYARKTGLAKYRVARTQKDTNCFVCGNSIKKGQIRYALYNLSLCVDCAFCWKEEGGMLGNISRAKK